jgi:osmotically-inducible protein OsmY
MRKPRHPLRVIAALVGGLVLAAFPAGAAPRPGAGQQAASAASSGSVAFRGLTGDKQIRPDNPPGDQTLADRVRQALASDPYVGKLEIGVRVEHGVAYLSRNTETPFQRSRAEIVAARVPDIVAVVSQLGVEQGRPRTDDELLAAVRDELYWNPVIDLKDIAVSVDHGVVTLKGTAENWQIRGEAADDALAAGASDVRNDIRVLSGGVDVTLPSQGQ